MTRFNPLSGLIIVVVEVWGPGGSRLARLALDTGATASVIDAAILASIVRPGPRLHSRADDNWERAGVGASPAR